MTAVVTRRARAADVPAIRRIYNQGIAERLATFETRPRTDHEVHGWLDHRYPVLVTVSKEEVVAFATTFPYGQRDCYRGIAEYSVYVDRSYRGRGIGRQTLRALIDVAAADGFWKLVSRIFPENEVSRGLHRSLGFREVGTYRRHARLDGVWRDVVIVEYLLPGPAQSE